MILHVAAGSAWWLFAAATLILFLHIAGGTVGNATAPETRKGGRVQRPRFPRGKTVAQFSQ